MQQLALLRSDLFHKKICRPAGQRYQIYRFTRWAEHHRLGSPDLVPDLFLLFANCASPVVICLCINPTVESIIVEHIDAGLQTVQIHLVTPHDLRSSRLLGLIGFN